MRNFILLILSCLSFGFNLVAGDIYQKGTVTLVSDNSFAQGIDWSKIFIANFSTPPKPNMTTYESLAIAPDGTIYVVEYSNMTAGNLFRFDSTGKLQDTKQSGDANASVWARHPALAAVSEKNELWISEYGGIARCDRQGRVLARTKLDYSVSDLVSLKNGALMLSSSVVTSKPSNPFKLSVILRDTGTAKETVIASYYQNPFFIPLRVKIQTEKGMVDSIVSIGMTSKLGKLMIAGTPEGNLVAGYSDSPEILIFSAEGRKVGGFTLGMPQPALTPKLRAQAMKRIDSNLDSLAARNGVPADEIARGKEKLKDYPGALPYYSNLLVDDQGNILVFLNNSDNSPNIEFTAFSQSGKELRTCRLILPQDVSLRVDGRKQMFIRNGFLYALINKDVSGKKQVQLARFKLE